MKKILISQLFLLPGIAAMACPVCERKQPRILRGITHGAGPESNWDYLIISVAAAIVVFTLYFSVKWLVRPGEKSGTHIKQLVLNNE